MDDNSSSIKIIPTTDKYSNIVKDNKQNIYALNMLNKILGDNSA